MVSEKWNNYTSNETEAFLFKRGTFAGPLPPVRLNDRIVQWVRKTKSLGITLDDKLKWKEHAEEIKLAFACKLNLLKSINFLPKHVLEDSYWKVIFPAVTCGILVWGSCGKTQFTALEKIHAKAARIIHRLDWNLSSHDVMLKTGRKTLMDTYKQRLLITFYVCSNNEAPEKLCRNIMETKNKNLRGEKTAVIQRPRTEFLHASVTFRGAVLKNKLPAKIRNDRNYERFKKVIKQIDLDQMDFCTYNNKDEIYLYE